MQLAEPNMNVQSPAVEVTLLQYFSLSASVVPVGVYKLQVASFLIHFLVYGAYTQPALTVSQSAYDLGEVKSEQIKSLHVVAAATHEH
jgi:hypothetical protein